VSDLDSAFFLGLALGLPIGIISSLISWAILFHVLVPKIRFKPIISKVSHESGEGYRYRVSIENSGWRRAVDLEIMCRLQVLGLHKNTPSIWKQVNLAIAGERIPDIAPRKPRKIRILAEKTLEFKSEIYPEDIKLQAANGSLNLESLLQLGEDAKIVVYVFLYDSFSGTRKMFTSPDYRAKNIFEGRFAERPAWWKY